MAATDAAIVCWAAGPVAPGPTEGTEPTNDMGNVDHVGLVNHTGSAKHLGHADTPTAVPDRLGAAVAAVLGQLGPAVRRGRRTVLVLAGAPAAPHPSPSPWRAAPSPSPWRAAPPPGVDAVVVVPRLCAALRHAVTLLADAEADLALLATELDDEPGRWLVVALRRSAEAWHPDTPPLAVVRATDDLTAVDRSRCGVLRPGDLRRMLAAGCAAPNQVADHRAPTAVALPDTVRRGHAVLLLPPAGPTRPAGDPLLVRWSARDGAAEERLCRAMGRLARFDGDLFGDDRRRVESLARHAASRATSPVGVRGAVVAATAAEAADALDRRRPVTPQGRPVALLFPGQGAQYPRMGAGLYEHDPVFTAAMDTFFALWGDGGDRLRAEWLSADPDVPFDDGSRAQPLLFAVGYALGAMVRAWGVRPVALLGHSAGEMVAATLGGAFSLPAAVALMRARVTEVLRTPPGGMLAVAATADELQPYLSLDPTGQVAVAAVNAPRQTMLAGPDEALAVVREKLREQGYVCRLARARQAFHSPAVHEASLATRPAVEAARPGPPVDTVYSAYTGRKLDDATAGDPAFWTTQIADPVLFWPALDALLGTGELLLVEAGAGQGLTNVARQHRAVRSKASDVLGLLPAAPGAPAADRRAALTVAARLWTEGHDLRWDAVDGLAARRA
ncbi:acyltransferase domain-containing protein [Micromonospora sp. WMMD882]|uniref:acyltransferase domain-containing protein n=1 Tax=Micromonospora sp. WMMD882 TaxID=3015151 RepID=UPI00248AE65F|nr:acyltransferase domain-containing protein [Micromonospora sp. WMMD882]WBB81499.1 acyltransferase domain-containing protein [Micromonospora sp. WMMD882]